MKLKKRTKLKEKKEGNVKKKGELKVKKKEELINSEAPLSFPSLLKNIFLIFFCCFQIF
jgi:hypothetical protein